MPLDPEGSWRDENWSWLCNSGFKDESEGVSTQVDIVGKVASAREGDASF